jgi:carboxypeptidase D
VEAVDFDERELDEFHVDTPTEGGRDERYSLGGGSDDEEEEGGKGENGRAKRI